MHRSEPSETTGLVGVGVPVYNGEKLIRRALTSLLAQDYPSLEVVISDNGSTDGTAQICREIAARDPRVRYHRAEPNRGAVWNFNRVFELSRGEFFMWAAHDDLWSPSCIRECVAVLRAHPEAALCHSASQPADSDGRLVGEAYVHPDFVNEDASAERRWQHAITAWLLHAAIYGVMRRSLAARTRLLQVCSGADQIFVAELSLHGAILRTRDSLSSKRVDPAPSHTEMLAYLGGSKREPALLWSGIYYEMLRGLMYAPLARATKRRLALATLGACATQGMTRDFKAAVIRMIGAERYHRMRRRPGPGTATMK